MNKIVFLATATLILLSPGLTIPQAISSTAGFAFPFIHTVTPPSSTVVLLTPTQIQHAYARAHQVSMSWGGSESSSDPSSNSHFQVTGVTFFASSGDSGHGLIYPSTSPFVVSVGGTTLTLGSGGNVVSETAWSGSGGGNKPFADEPSYKKNHPKTTHWGFRGNPHQSHARQPAPRVAGF